METSRELLWQPHLEHLGEEMVDEARSQTGVAAVQALFVRGAEEIGKVIAGQEEAVALALATVLCGSHALIEGVPGVAKTLTVKTLARFLGLGFRRVQGTPDMMPADILGTSIFAPNTGEFRFHPGPVFTQFLLADEVNRVPPRTQAALLESMEERQVTADGERLELDPYFTVFATQNPVEFEGTYPLPEAQLDRFLLKINVGYPALHDERTILERHGSAAAATVGGIVAEVTPIDPTLLAAARRELRAVRVETPVLDYLLAVVRRTREWPSLSLGASPRAGTSLLLVAKALAAREGRDFVVPDDVKQAAIPTLRHRLVLRPEAELEGLDPDRIVREVLAATPVPK